MPKKPARATDALDAIDLHKDKRKSFEIMLLQPMIALSAQIFLNMVLPKGLQNYFTPPPPANRL